MPAGATLLPSGRVTPRPPFSPGSLDSLQGGLGWEVFWILGVSSADSGHSRPHEPHNDLSYFPFLKLFSLPNLTVELFNDAK